MEDAKRFARIANILQTIWFALLILVGTLNVLTKVFNLVPANGVGRGGIFSIIVLLILLVLGWMAASRLEDRGWRIILLIVALLSFFYASSLISGVLFLIAFFKSKPKA